MLFPDRHDAGKQLAQQLLQRQYKSPFVMALPRGGVVVGYEVAKALNAPLDVLVVRKLGVPDQPELAMGAIADNGVCILNQQLIHMLKIPEWQVKAAIEKEQRELERRLALYRGDRPMPDLKDKSVILVDDGLATGATARAAIRLLRQIRPLKVILAIPVCAPDTAASLGREVDELICLSLPTHFGGVGAWYQDFQQTSDEEVVELLRLTSKVL